MLVQVKVRRICVDEHNGHPLVVLQEDGGERVLSILIGTHDAFCIRRGLWGFHWPRPLTLDVIDSIIDALDGDVYSVEITNLVGNTYHAAINLKKGNDFIRIDARPSDAIALALVCQPARSIYVEEKLFAAMGCISSQDTSYGPNGGQPAPAKDGRNDAAHADHANAPDKVEAAIAVERRWAFGVFFPPPMLDPRLLTQRNDLLIDVFLRDRNIYDGDRTHVGTVALTGLDEKPLPGTHNRCQEAKPTHEQGPHKP
jgi:bifunctional DNase/RNase